MAIPRNLLQGHHLFARSLTRPCVTGSIVRVLNTSKATRQFSLSVRELAQTPATGSEILPTWTQSLPAPNNAHSIQISRLRAIATPAEVEKLLHDAGVEIKRMQLLIDRFDFMTRGFAYVELGSKEQVQKAVMALNGYTSGNNKIFVDPLHDMTEWNGTAFEEEKGVFVYDKNSASQSLQRLIEGRRYGFFVENPGWRFDKSDGPLGSQKRTLLRKTLEPFGVETMSRFPPYWRDPVTGKKVGSGQAPSVALVDFKTKVDAERAVEALNDQIIKGCRVKLMPDVLGPPLAKRIARLDQSLLAHLEHHGVVVDSRGAFNPFAYV